MDKQQDRIAIISAIEDASANELKALADIKNAITAKGTLVAGAGENQGRVTRRLSHINKQAPVVTNDVSGIALQHENVYVSRMPKKARRKPKLVSDLGNVLQNNQTSEPAEKNLKNSVTLKRSYRQNIQRIHNDTTANSSPKITQRDGKGRFISENKQSEIAENNNRKKQNSATAKLQEGFLRRLGSIIGLDDKHDKAEGSDVTDAAGVGVGGPLWMAASGVVELAKETGGKAISLKKWVDELNGDKKDVGKKSSKVTSSTQSEALSYPPAQAKPISAPELGKVNSSKIFAENQASQSVKVIQEQTKALSSNDDRIIGTLEDVEDEIIKLRKSMSSGGSFNMPDFFRNRWPGGRRGTKRRAGGGSTGRGNNRGERPDSIEKSTRKTRGTKPKGRFGRIGKIFSSVGAKVAAGTAATIGAVTGAGALSSKGANTAANTAKPILKESKAAAQVTAKGTEAAVAKQAGSATGIAAEKSVETAATKQAGKVTGSVALRETEHAAAKMGAKAAAKGALRFIPGVGTALLAGYDAVEGFNDEDAQREAFGVAEGKEVSTKQKTAYAGANVLDMGGLLTGATNLVGQGLSAVGLSGTGDKLQSVGTDSIARGLEGGMDFAQSIFSGAKNLAFGAAANVVDKVKSGFRSDEDSTKQLKTSIEDGTRKTVSAIEGLKGQLQGGQFGEDGVGEHGYTSKAEFTAPAANNIAADLNIGGSNAKNRNFRNNNPGNLVFANQEGASLEAANSNGEQRFAKFNTPEEGIRGLANQVSSYYEGTSKAAGYEKLQTVSSIISKWAPPNENNTNQYIKNVCDYLGVSPNEKIDASDPEVMTRLVRAIATKEGGNPAVNDGYIKDALGTFNRDTGKWEGKFSNESLTKINAARTANGEQAIAADSQYSFGSKVKLANSTGTALAPQKNAVSFKTPITDSEVAQRAQSVKKPVPTHVLSPKPNVSNETAFKLAQQHSAKALTATPAGLLTEETAATKVPQDGLMSTIGDLGASSTSAMTGLMSANTPEAIQAAIAKSRELDKQISAKVQDWTGKKVGFTPAAPLAALQQVKRPSARQDTGKRADIDLLGTASQDDQNPPLNERGIPVYNNGYKVIEQGEGGSPSLFESSVEGLKNIGSAILPTAGEHVSRVIGGISGGGVVNDLMSQVTGGNSDIARAVSPLTQKAGKLLDGGIQSVASTVSSNASGLNSTLFGAQPKRQEPFLSMPQQLPTVTDLARSGVRQTLTTDNINNDPAMLKTLDGVYSVLKDILGATKSGSKGDPDKVVKTAQPQPRERASTTISDPSLDVLLED
ncbi:transglycosylase (plasmid) [Enterobacter sp. JBIWA008]|uniref:transglycosylase n=1 Tax=Enterobacter sp. JBIWA008 TaxID=2831892 RepID=UPI001CC1B02B|nr:transglycosylase [Enterobacter sp. JBIWA008]UAN43389.1 transglycosylase [Enterobacter sp. JBIWA008]